MPKPLLFIGLFLLFPIYGMGTHLIGGEITYQCEGYNEDDDTYTYTITLTVYNDCGPANVNNTFFDDIASVGIFSDGTLSEELLIFYPGNYEFIDTELNNECVTSPISACVRKAIYEESIDLDFADGGYDVVYQRCCRNWSISNVTSAGTTGMTLHAYIPEPEDEDCNSSPVFDVLPPSFLCTDYEFELDFSASDADGDSLVYSLCTPLYGADVNDPQPAPPDAPPYYEISWAWGYSEIDPFSTIDGLILDSETGILTGQPNEVGIFAIAICVSEYRDGEFLSKISRDYQINIYNCPSVIESIFAQQEAIDLCTGMEVEFVNISTNSSEFYWDFGVEGIESDISTLVEPTFVFPSPGTYTVMLIAEPNSECADTSYQDFFIDFPIDAYFELPSLNCNSTETTFNFEALGNYSGEAAFFWNFGGGNTTSEQNPQEIPFPGPGSYNINLSIQANGCLSNYIGEITIPDDVVAAIAPQTEFCNGLDISFINSSQNAQNYQWIVGDPGEQMYSIETNPSFTFENEGIYPAMLISFQELSCPDTAIQFVEVFPYMMPFFSVPMDVYCFEDHQIELVAGGIFESDSEIEWDFGANASQAFSSDLITENITYSEPGYYPVTLTVYENGCEKNYTQEVVIHPNPKASFTPLDSNGCKPLPVQFINLSEAWTDMQYEWEFGNGAFSVEENPNTTYSYSGNFFPKLTVSTNSGCIDEDTFILEWPIHVYPLPQAYFTVEPNVVNILDPEVYITDYSSNSIDVFYDIGNGDSISTANSAYTFSDAGNFTITQTVWNQFGCSDQVTAGVNVKGFLFFMPNSFTPNGDGYNDVLAPEHTGIKDYLIQIYDRWGQNVFSSTDPNHGWDGQDAPYGVYNYIVKINDLNLVPHHFGGSITLIR